jgi:hypothetical protein
VEGGVMDDPTAPLLETGHGHEAMATRPWPDRKLDELGEMFVTALAFLWLGSGALIYLLVGLLMIAVVVVVAPPVRLYLLARNAWRRSKPRSHGEFGDWNPW